MGLLFNTQETETEKKRNRDIKRETDTDIDIERYYRQTWSLESGSVFVKIVE